MGLIKDTIKLKQPHWLENYGFKYKSNPVAGWEPGYERGYYHADNSEFLWVNVCFPKRAVYLYNEYDCGGLLWERELSIPDEFSEDDEENFINWLDKELDID